MSSAVFMMNFPAALIFLILSTVADLAHHEDTNFQCRQMLGNFNFNLNNVELLEQLVDNRIRAALANAPGTIGILGLCIYLIQ